MNILILIPNITKRAGTERAVTNLANILSDGKNNVFIFSVGTHCGDSPFQLKSNVNIVHMGLLYNHKTIIGKVLLYIKLYIILKKEIIAKNIDFVIGTYHYINFTVACLPKNIKKIGCEHFNYAAFGNFINILKRFFYKKLDSVVLLTERDKKSYSFLNNVSVIPNSLSFATDKVSNCMNKQIVSLGRLSKQKGYDLLLKSALLMKEKLPDWHITIYGDGEDRLELQKTIASLNLGGFVTIKLPVKDVEEVYLESSIYVSSSRWEGLPMVLLEAQSCGVPAVCFDCECGPSDVIIDGKTGFLVPPLDIEKLADKVVELAQNDKERIEFGENAVISVQRFSTERIKELWENLLYQLAQK